MTRRSVNSRAALLPTLALSMAAWPMLAAATVDPPAGQGGDRDEAEMFGDDGGAEEPGGGKPPAQAPAAPSGPGGGAVEPKAKGTITPAPPASADDKSEEDGTGEARMGAVALEPAAQDRLQIGGLLYMRNGWNLNDQDGPLDQALTVSNLMDVYFDARPNDRVRAFARGRLLWTPTLVDASSAGVLGFAGGQDELTPQLVELWLKFDLARQLYISIGAQQVRFGATRLWNPVDFLYATRRSPLTLFDQRTGLPMLKLHVPIESLGWNAYAIAISEDANSLRGVRAVGRLEVVLSTIELGLMAQKRLGADPQIGLDISAGVLQVDVGAELGMRRDAAGAWHWMASAKLEHTIAIGEDDNIIWGFEGFYNPEGYASLDAELDAVEGYAKELAIASAAGAPTPAFPLSFFYTGRWYAALFAVAMGPGSWNDTSITVSALANLSDGSGMLRLDVGQTLLQHLRLEAFAGLNLGSDGEFRFYTEGMRQRLGPLVQAAGLDPATLFKRPLASFGLNLRMSL